MEKLDVDLTVWIDENGYCHWDEKPPHPETVTRVFIRTRPSVSFIHSDMVSNYFHSVPATQGNVRYISPDMEYGI